MDTINKTLLYAALETAIKQAGNQQAAATKLGVSPSYLSDVLSGRKEPGKKILEPLGLVRVVSYMEQPS